MSKFDDEKMSNAIRAKVAALVAASTFAGTLSIQWDNTMKIAASAPVDNQDSWLMVSILHGETKQADMGTGNNRFRRKGIVRLSIFTEIGKGDKEALEISGMLANGMRFVKIAAVDGAVQIRTPSLTRVGRDGNWWRLNLDCPFFADDFEA